jgi:type II secretory pathway predicted ATPase ExeA
VDAIRVCAWQRVQPVLVVDDIQDLVERADRGDLERLVSFDPGGSIRLTVLVSAREPAEAADTVPGSWGLVACLQPLTRSESDRYVEAKLAAAGRLAPAFTPRALDLLHALSGGVPRGLDRLGSLALMAGSLRRLEVIPPDVIEGVAQECAEPWHGFAA